MKNYHSSHTIKVLLVLLQQVFAVVAFSLLGSGLYYANGYQGVYDLMKNKPFEESEYFSTIAKEEIYELGTFIKSSDNFEMGGKYTPDKVVDISNYAENGIITGNVNRSFGYTIEELIRWADEGVEDTTIIVCKKADGTYDYYTEADFSANLQAGKIIVNNDMSGTDYSSEVQDEFSADSIDADTKTASEETSVHDVTNATDKDITIYEESWGFAGIKEKYEPRMKDGSQQNLIVYANNDAEANGNLNSYYENLRLALEIIVDDVLTYKEGISKWELSNINFVYYCSSNRNLITNSDKYTDADKLDINLEEMELSGKYLMISSKNIDIKTNLNINKKEFYQTFPIRRGDYTLGVTINTDFSVKDNLYEEKVRYEQIQPWFKMFVALVILCVIGYVLCMLLLTARAGRTGENGKVKLSWIDKIPVEIFYTFVLFFMLMSVIPLMTAVTFHKTALAVSIFFLNLVTAIGYLSTVRRVKAHTLWKSSILRSLIKGIQNGYDNRSLTVKTLLLYSGFILMNILFVIGGPLILVAILVDIIVGAAVVREGLERKKIIDGVHKISEGNVKYKIDLAQIKNSANLKMAKGINIIGEGIQNAVEENTKSEKLKTALITNVSHDIKTPLTSIINYIDLLKRENIEDERMKGYIVILEKKAQRLKHLTEDLVEASKISSGNIKLQFEQINFVELLHQTAGEFIERFEAKDLELVMNTPEIPMIILADGRRIWRVIENLFNNVAKYALEGTRVYIDVTLAKGMMACTIKNISKFPLNIPSEELTERFIRGDISRSTEGSGLGLSIAKNLTELQRGQFDIYLDGDLFKALIRFPLILR